MTLLPHYNTIINLFFHLVLLNGDDDELEREHVLLVIRSGVTDSFDTIASHDSELGMLAHMSRMMSKNRGSSGRSNGAQVAQGMYLFVQFLFFTLFNFF